MSALRRGDRFLLDGRKWRVAYVTASRAHCVATVRAPVTRRTWTGEARTYQATRRLTTDISPTTDLQLVTELCGRGR